MLTSYAETPLPDADPAHFLDWFPTSNPDNANAPPPPTMGPPPIQDRMALQSDFQRLVVGVHQFGCGIESQLESWYRFLVQPDPYADLTTSTVGEQAARSGSASTRRSSSSATTSFAPTRSSPILVLTDENDSEIDVRSLRRQGWNFMARSSTRRAARPSARPTRRPGCTSCAFRRRTAATRTA